MSQTSPFSSSHKSNTSLNRDAIDFLMDQLPSWQVRSLDGINILVRVFKFSNFQQALEFTCKVGELAERENHHPALLTEWGKVTVSWWTHSVGGLQDRDFILAARTEELFQIATH